jgi:hypothetical protein
VPLPVQRAFSLRCRSNGEDSPLTRQYHPVAPAPIAVQRCSARPEAASAEMLSSHSFARDLEQATPLRHIIPLGVLRDTTVILARVEHSIAPVAMGVMTVGIGLVVVSIRGTSNGSLEYGLFRRRW